MRGPAFFYQEQNPGVQGASDLLLFTNELCFCSRYLRVTLREVIMDMRQVELTAQRLARAKWAYDGLTRSRPSICCREHSSPRPEIWCWRALMKLANTRVSNW